MLLKTELVPEKKNGTSDSAAICSYLAKMMMKKPHVLTRLSFTASTLLLINGLAQPSFSFPALPTVLGNNNQSAISSIKQAEAHNNSGVELAQQGKLTQAIAAFNQAIKIYPKFEKAHNNLGLALGSQNKFSEAAAAFKRALAINPQNFETYNNLGIALGSQGKLAEAIAVFNQAIQINPKDPTSRQNLGVAFWSQGKLPEAVASLQKAQDLYSAQKNTEGVAHVGEILQQIKLP